MVYEGFPFDVGDVVEAGDVLGIITCIDGPGTQTPGSQLTVKIEILGAKAERTFQGWWSGDRLGDVRLRHVTAPRPR